MDMQDVSQPEGSEGLDSNSLDSGSQQEVGSNSAGGNQAPNSQSQVAPKMVDAERHNKLMSAHQKALGDFRKAQSEVDRFSKESEQWKSEKAELLARMQRLETGREQAPEQDQEPDMQGWTHRQIMDYLVDKSSKTAEERAWQRIQKEQQERESKMEEQRANEARESEEQWYQSQWDALFAKHPDVNVQEVEDFIAQNRVFNPLLAYESMNRGSLTKQEVSKAQRETANKIATNKKNFTESSGKAGIEAPSKPNLGDSKSRKANIAQLLREQLGVG